MLKIATMLFSIVGLAACVPSAERPLAETAASCSNSGGDWTPWVALYPAALLNERDTKGSMCNLRTPDSGKACTDRIGQCQGVCVAPAGSSAGQFATGTCSAHFHVPQSVLLLERGRVVEQLISGF